MGTSDPRSRALYGGYDPVNGDKGNSGLLGAEQNQWSQLGQQGVQINDAASQGQRNNLAGTDAWQKQSWGDAQSAAGLMRAQAMGGQTPAMQQSMQARQYGQNAASAMQANAGGPQALAAARSANANNMATSGAMNANADRALAAQERMNGINAYSNMSNQMRSNAATQNQAENDYDYAMAGQQMDRNKANDQMWLGYQGLTDQSNTAQDQLATNNAQFNMNNAQQNFQTGTQFGAAITNSASGAAKAYDQSFGSDERVKASKKSEHNSGSLMSPFLDTLARSRATYRYKDRALEPGGVGDGGRYAGVMAQDLERVPELGHGLVFDSPTGKRVNSPAALSALLAGVGDLHERVSQLEGHRKYEDD